MKSPSVRHEKPKKGLLSMADGAGVPRISRSSLV